MLQNMSLPCGTLGRVFWCQMAGPQRDKAMPNEFNLICVAVSARKTTHNITDLGVHLVVVVRVGVEQPGIALLVDQQVRLVNLHSTRLLFKSLELPGNFVIEEQHVPPYWRTLSRIMHAYKAQLHIMLLKYLSCPQATSIRCLNVVFGLSWNHCRELKPRGPSQTRA
jgi:hypothetical protein